MSRLSIFCRIFLSHSAEKFRRGIFYCCNTFGYRNSLFKGGSITIFRRGFCLTVPKCFIGEHFGVFFYRTFFSHSAENFRRGILYCCNNFGYRKSLDKGGGVSRFSLEVLVSLYRNISLENTLVFQNNSFIENFHAKEGGITVLSELFVSQDRNEKLCKGTFLFSGNFLVSKKNYG